ncbi:unnamed protein product [Taenia asiatica]|uniref:Uncharacterized protein n=1 Tax=Taenia asiatica TaxID=60517 RepID=A0A0R3WFZ0_TAEAS|nr:unnamed protein product [Taenia asiatica]
MLDGLGTEELEPRMQRGMPHALSEFLLHVAAESAVESLQFTTLLLSLTGYALPNILTQHDRRTLYSTTMC